MAAMRLSMPHTKRYGFCGLAALLVLLLAPAPARADAVPVMVLYFDNNSKDAELDPLQKGLADMLITDLSGVADLQVVERARLEQVLRELQLQRTSYFDPKTAQRIGGGVGAQYAIAGAFTLVGKELRLDVRILRVDSGEIVRSAQASGERDRFFALQQQLTARFIEGLGPALRWSAARVRREREALQNRQDNRAPDLDFALVYGRSLDLADRGDPAAAAQALQGVLPRAPGFVLGRTRLLQTLQAAISLQGPSDPPEKQAACQAVRRSGLLCEAPPSPPPQQAAPPHQPPPPISGPGGGCGAQRQRGVALEIGLGAAAMVQNGSVAAPPVRTGLFGGYKLGCAVIVGLAFELAYSAYTSSSGGESPMALTTTTGTTSFLIGPALRAAVVRSADGRLELALVGGVSYGRTAEAHRMAFEAGAGPRFWLHRQFAVSASSGLRGDFALGDAGTSLLGIFATVQALSIF